MIDLPVFDTGIEKWFLNLIISAFTMFE